jgi:hypothetical protein
VLVIQNPPTNTWPYWDDTESLDEPSGILTAGAAEAIIESAGFATHPGPTIAKIAMALLHLRLQGLSDKEKLKVYDKLREAHKIIDSIYAEELLDSANDIEGNVVDTVRGVLYLAEGEFARMRD